ncbi:MAG TPA: LysR family transcriptional regulator [Gemmatimonadaceae bacterium]|jgi:DNA-binding transcriptional LysR family regulator|nr:LysR family transcriptional regulator [Gemmatimonadaceae bacterium]
MPIIRRMNLAGVDLNLLIALDALVLEQHVGRAGRRVGLSQPAMSHALKRLRVLLGDPLIVRDGKRSRLTARAAALREPLADAIRATQAVFGPDTFDASTSTQRFRVMMHDHIGHMLVPALVTGMQKAAPKATLDVVPWRNPFAASPAQLHDIDFIVSCSERSLAGWVREVLCVDTEVLVARRGHPLRSRLARRATFLQAGHVAVIGHGTDEDPIDAWLRELGLARRVVLRVPTYLQALQSVAATDLVAVVPRELARSVATSLAIAIRKPPIDPGDYREHFFYPTHAVGDRASRWFRDLIHSVGLT